MKKNKTFFLAAIQLLIINHIAYAYCDPAFTSTTIENVVSFQALSTNPQLIHVWYFGDNSAGFGSNPSHTYSFNGSYTVKHVLKDSLNTCLDSVSQVITVDFAYSCKTAIQVIPDSILSNRYYFYSTSSAIGGNVESYRWTIDGQVYSNSTYLFADLNPGTHNVCLSISTSTACTSTSCQTISVIQSQYCDLQASFTYTVDGADPKSLTFMPASSGATLKYYWNFGDGYNSTEVSPVHNFAYPGNFRIRLLMTDDLTHCYDSTVQLVQVNGTACDTLAVAYTYEADPNNPAQYFFKAQSNELLNGQNWTITNRDDSAFRILFTANNPAYTFTDTGYFMVCLYATTNSGCFDQYCDFVHVTTITPSESIVPSYPNPARNMVTLTLKMAESGKIRINIYNVNGNIVYSSQKQGNAGINQVSISVEKLQQGQYFMDIQNGNQRRKSIFQKM